MVALYLALVYYGAIVFWIVCATLFCDFVIIAGLPSIFFAS